MELSTALVLNSHVSPRTLWMPGMNSGTFFCPKFFPEIQSYQEVIWLSFLADYSIGHLNGVFARHAQFSYIRF